MNLFQLGVDVAKAKLDCVLRLPDGKRRHKVVENSPAGFQALRVLVEIDAELSAEDKQAFLQEVERRCPLADNLTHGTQLHSQLVLP